MLCYIQHRSCSHNMFAFEYIRIRYKKVKRLRLEMRVQHVYYLWLNWYWYQLAHVAYPEEGPNGRFTHDACHTSNNKGITQLCIQTWTAMTANRMPQATPTRIRTRTITQQASWLTRFNKTNMLATNHPQDHVSLMKLHWADHCSHIRKPSSMNVLTIHRRATGRKMCFPWRSTYNTTKLNYTLMPDCHICIWMHANVTI